MIELKNVSKYYNANGTTALGLHNISLNFNKGEIVAIVGDSGSGKSTLLNVISKIDNFDDGEVYYKGNETSYFSISDMDNFRKNKVGFIFQNYNIIESYTVFENVMLPLTIKGMNKEEAKEKALELIKKVGLHGKERNRGSKLSGGEKQRCVIARALASDCEILACDEPTGNLDSNTGIEIVKLIAELAKDKLVLIVTHTYEVFENIVTRKIEIKDGEVIADKIFQRVEKDENEKLNLDYQPLSRKVELNLAKNNVKFTPKKTVLTFLIFFVIAFTFLFQVKSIDGLTEGMSNSNEYGLKTEQRIVVYHNDYQAINLEDIQSLNLEYSVNQFAEDILMSVYFDDSYYGEFYYGDYISNVTIKEGSEPTKKDEIMLILPSSYVSSVSYNKMIHNTISIGTMTGKYEQNLTIACIAESSSIQKPVLSKNEGVANYFSNIMASYSATVTYKGEEMKVTSSYSTINEDGLKLLLPIAYENACTISITMGNIYLLNNRSYQVEYVSYIDSPVLEINYDKVISKDAYMVSVYTNNVSDTTRKLTKLGYDVDYPIKLSTEHTLMDLLTNLLMGFGIVGCIFMLLFAFFISYFILERVYRSKKNDYEILRTLGVSKKDMRFIVKYEVYIISFTACLGAIILYYILGFTFTQPLFIWIIYVVAMYLFSFAIARKFNKRLFKFTVTKSLKGDGEDD